VVIYYIMILITHSRV